MSEREDNVYKAKLAEQAERYDGMLLFLSDFTYMLSFCSVQIADLAEGPRRPPSSSPSERRYYTMLFSETRQPLRFSIWPKHEILVKEIPF